MKRSFSLVTFLALSVVAVGQIDIPTPPGSPGMTRTQGDLRWANLSSLRNQGLTVIGNRTAHGGAGLTNSGGAGQYMLSSRMQLRSPWTCYAPRILYANWYVNGVGENAAPCDYWVNGSFMNLGTTINDSTADYGWVLTFNGVRKFPVVRGGTLLSDAVRGATIQAGIDYFVKTCTTCLSPSAPSAPTVAATSGSTGLGNNPYYVCVTIVYPDGTESLPSTYTAVTTTTGNQVITITAPPAVSGAIGYRSYINYGSSSGLYSESNAGVMPFTVNATITTGPSTAIGNVGLRCYNGAIAQLTAYSGTTLGGTGPGASNNGEGLLGAQDATTPGLAIGANRSTSINFPIAVLAYVPGGVKPSVAIVGSDSIANGTQDCAYGYTHGGYLERALAGQTANIAYDPSITPLYGRINLATSGESASSFASVGGSQRTNVACMCTEAWVEDGTNDLGSGAAPIVANLISIHQKFLSQGMYTKQFCILPRATTTDYYSTLANQSTAALQEADRRALNNSIIDSTSASMISSESLFRAQSAAYVYGSNPYSGGDAATTKFATAYPFKIGTEAITNAGTACTYNASPSSSTQYSYYGTATINGAACASGIIFGSAPSNANAIVGAYTKCDGFGSILGSKYTAKSLTMAAGVEYNSSGNIAFNGGYWLTSSTIGGQAAHSLTSLTSSSITDSSQSWTQDQWRNQGMCAVIVTDSVTPTAVGQINPIMYNTSTVLTLSNNWAITPSTSATYAIMACPTAGDVHPTSWLHRKLAAAIGLTPSSLVYP